MSFTFNHFEVIEIGALHNLVNAVHLNLSFNQITNLNQNTFSCKMVNLVLLDLQGNRLTILPRQQFYNLYSAKLRLLSIQNNPLQEIHEWAFSGLIYLKTLNMQGMDISLLQKFSFANVTSLNQLNLSNNKISILQENTFYKTYLHMLDISGNEIKVIYPDVIRYLLGISVTFPSIPMLSCIQKDGANSHISFHVLSI